MSERILQLGKPRVKVTRRNDKSGYDCASLGFLPGATTILGKTSAGKEALQRWLARPDAPALSAAARNRGTWLHSQTEAWIDSRLRGLPPPDTKHFAYGGYWRSMKPWLEAHYEHATAIEKPVCSPSMYAGCFDFLGYLNYGNSPQSLTLADWKTAQRPRGDTSSNDPAQNPLIADYFDQLGAYSKAIDYVYGIQVERALLVIARPATAPDVWELNAEELAAATQRFEARLQQYYSMPND